MGPELEKSDKVSLIYFTLDGFPITSAAGLRIVPDLSVEQVNVDDISMLILPGGSAWEEEILEAVDGLVAAVHSQGIMIAAICGATVYLAKMAYLDEVKHTSNSLEYLKYMAPEYKGEVYYQSDVSFCDGHIITASGVAPIEFAREVFEAIELQSKDEIEKWFKLFKNGIYAS